MKTINRALASMLAVVMLVCMLPTAAFAGHTEGTPDEVIYNLLDMPVTVGTDPARAESEDELYFLFEEDGSFDIWLEDNAFFPYEVQFTYGGETWTEWFMTPDDTVEVGGHTFTVTSNVTDPEALLQLGVKVGEDYIPAYPAAKEFTTEPQMSTFSLMPIREERINLDLRDYLPVELESVSIEWIIGDEIGTEKKVLWNKYGYYRAEPVGDEFEYKYEYVEWSDVYSVLETDTLNLNSLTGYSDAGYMSEMYNETYFMDFIVGTVDQLNTNNVHYIVEVRTAYYDDLFETVIYTADNPRVEIPVVDEEIWCEARLEYEIFVDEVDVPDIGEEVYLTLLPKRDFRDLEICIYDGDRDVTDQIWDQKDMANSGGYLGDFAVSADVWYGEDVRVEFKRDGVVIDEFWLDLQINGVGISVDPVWAMFKGLDRSGGEAAWISTEKYEYIEDSDLWLRSTSYEMGWDSDSVELDQYYPADGQYYFSFNAYAPDGRGVHRSAIKKAVVGYYATEADIPANATDLKEQLFLDENYAGEGYLADFSEGVTFTVVDVRGAVHHFKITTVDHAEEAFDENKMLEIGLNGVGYERDVDVNSGYVWFNEFNSYEMPEEADSYYANGYRTMFLYDEDSDSEFYNIVPDVEVWPLIGYAEEDAELFLGHDGTSGEKYVWGETKINLKHNEPLNLSTVWNGKVKNYWVTYLTQQKGPSLFVNATNDESRYVNVTSKGYRVDEYLFRDVSDALICAEALGLNANAVQEEAFEELTPQREVFFNEGVKYHDVFFANVGDEEIKGLYAKLENAQNVALDEYWDIGETTTLAAFTSADDDEMFNMGKIRLVPAKDENGNELSGEISGTLAIGYLDFEAMAYEEVRINLTGTAGTPKITTETVADATQHVPYAAIIQTNNMTSSNATFTISSGKLPNGLTLEKNGEITGVPSQAGEFTFTVKAVFNNDNSKSDTKEFTLTVLEDTPENIEAVNKGPNGYEIEEHLGTEVTGEDGKVSYELNMKEVADEELVFVSEGEFDEFVDFYIDSKKLTRDVDYTAEEGSTKITVRAQAFKKAGNGQHVIAAAFNSGGTLKKTAQSVTISGASKAGTGTVKQYKITVASAANGTITCTRTAAREKELVIVTVRPDAGYVVKSVSAGSGVSVSAHSGGEYWITMPAADVTISAVFEAIEQPSQPGGSGGTTQPVEPEQSELPFGDVAAEDAFYEAVKFVYENGIMVGTGENTFAPDANLSRAMVVQVLYNYEKQPEVAAGTDFTDVAEGQWYTSAVRWATGKGAVAGYGDGTFGTDDDVTIEQVAVILWNYAGQPVAEGETVPTESSQWAVNALDWCAKQGILEGVDAADTTVAATRAQTAQILMNFLSKLDRQ